MTRSTDRFIYRSATTYREDFKMKKLYLLLFTGMLALVLAACGGEETTTEQTDDEAPAETEAQETDETASEPEEEAEEPVEEESGDVKEVNETIVDNDNLTATITTIEKIVDTDWGESRYEVNMDIENKRDDTIEVQATEVAADGVMIDDYVFFSETISGGNMSNASMVIETFNEEELPEMNESLEFVLDVFNDEFTLEEQTEVSIELE